MTLAPGTRVGPYRIDGRLGAGATGEVYRAFDPRLAREVAIKMLSKRALTGESRARFEDEVQAVARLTHANIVAIFDVGEHEGVPYAVMELLDGETLRARLNRDGALPPEEAAAAARQIASALDAAHSRQIVHRDLKPENIFLVANGPIKLVDFGVAQVETPLDLDAARTTEIVRIVGTVGYMAPEQARGLHIDSRTDLFAFGAVFFEMLTGRRAFHGPSAVDILADIVGARKPLFDTIHRVPDWQKDIVLRCLEVHADARYQSARDLLVALGRSDETPKTASRAETARDHTSIAVLPFADLSQARDQAYLCEGIAEELITALAQIPGVRVASRSAAFRFGGSAIDVRAAGSALGVESVLEGSVRTAAARVRVTVRLTAVADGHLLWSRQIDRGLDDIFAVEDEIARTIVQTIRPAALTGEAAAIVAPSTGATEAYTEYLKGRYHWNKRSESGLDAAITHFTRAVTIDAAYSRGYAGLADAYATLALYGLRPPQEVMPLGKATALRALGLEPALVEAQVSLALVQAIFDWHWDEAEQSFRRATTLAPGYATAFQWYASNCLVPLGRFDEARRTMERAAAIDPTSLPVSTSIGVIEFYAGRFESACDALRRTLALDARFGPAHFFLGQALAGLGDARGALAHAEEAAALSGRTPESLAGLGVVAVLAGEPDRARHILHELATMSRGRYVSPGFVAQVHAAIGDDGDALDALESAYELRAADLAWLGCRPVFHRLHHDARFRTLVNRLDLGVR